MKRSSSFALAQWLAPGQPSPPRDTTLTTDQSLPTPSLNHTLAEGYPSEGDVLTSAGFDTGIGTGEYGSAARTRRLFRRMQAYRAAVAASLDPSTAGEGSSSAEPASDPLIHLPPNAFSEALRSLDPSSVAHRLDDAQGINISPGLSEFTPLGQAVDIYGVRKLYTTLLEGVLAACKARADAGYSLLMSDYIVLLRCAGAASDPTMAKRIWHTMESQHQLGWRDTASYREFVGARFLTDPLYAQNDLARFRPRPISLHKQKHFLRARALMRLKVLRRSLVSHQLRLFGQDRRDAGQRLPDHSHLYMRLRKRKPIRRVFQGLLARGTAVDEPLLCSAMVAFAWTGSLAFIKHRILRRYWGVVIEADKQTGRISVGGPPPFYARDSPLYPTDRLLHAIVRSFCSNAEIATAFKLVDFISQRWNVPVPDRVWFDLLEWTYIMASKPASTEWKALGYPSKVLRSSAILLIWDTMIAQPYCVKPGFDQHDILIKTLIHQRRFVDAARNMRDWRGAYRDSLVDAENGFYEHVHSLRSGGLSTRSWQRWVRARAHKAHVWYRVSSWCHSFLQAQRTRYSPGSPLGPHLEHRLIPRLVEDFRAFMPERIEYRVAAGRVSLQDPAATRRFRWQAGAVEMADVQRSDLDALSPSTVRSGRTADSRAGYRERQTLHRQFRTRRPHVWKPDENALKSGTMKTRDLEVEFT